MNKIVILLSLILLSSSFAGQPLSEDDARVALWVCIYHARGHTFRVINRTRIIALREAKVKCTDTMYNVRQCRFVGCYRS
jgi:hypothetical protein